MRWGDMEADCLVSIFQRLSLEDLTLSIPLVCKSWHRASHDPLCWRSLDFRKLDFLPWSKFGERAKKTYPRSPFSFSSFMRFAIHRSSGAAVELRFPLFLQVSIKDLAYASKECPRLKIVVLCSLKLEDEVHLPKLVGKWKELELLEMVSNPSSFSELAGEIRLNCKNFSGLKMSGVKKEDASAIVNHLPKLKYLNLNRSYLPKETLLAIMKGCEDLERLSAKQCIGFEADREVLDMAARIKSFEHVGSKLTLDDCNYDSDEYFPYLFQAM
ncbi:F-box/LRR-repeat protein-like [Iris pallida]|uniref:F-box/LRR-repeat protein-like n=1 Tax=Iris pallida TaxID=29817 RepID=A0AAX6GHZ6_IRIPA|nr:F-box/LRR-repeat protein-like [Iris pallida]